MLLHTGKEVRESLGGGELLRMRVPVPSHLVGKPVSIQDLILGMIVQSGNDATIALAERIAGTEETFAQLMNSNAKRLGMVGSHFEDSSGLPSPQHYTTARDLSLLASAIIREYPQYYKWFSVREFEHNGIKQQNRNGLLEKDPTVDGLKTGHTDSAGFCLVTSSLRDGMRLVSVVMGATSIKGRENASAALLNYGFTFYDTKLAVKGGTVLASAHVWKISCSRSASSSSAVPASPVTSRCSKQRRARCAPPGSVTSPSTWRTHRSRARCSSRSRPSGARPSSSA